ISIVLLSHERAASASLPLGNWPISSILPRRSPKHSPTSATRAPGLSAAGDSAIFGAPLSGQRNAVRLTADLLPATACVTPGLTVCAPCNADVFATVAEAVF